MKSEPDVQVKGLFHLIVVPHDLTGRSDKAVQLAGTIADPLHSEVVLVNVISPGDFHAGGPSRFVSELADLTEARLDYLQCAVKRLLPNEVKSDVRILSGDPQSVILDEAQKVGADLLIITTHPLSGAGYPFDGGKADHILHTAPCPVLTIQVPEEAETTWVEEAIRFLHPHDMNQYCELSRQLSKTHSFHPVYTGYSRTPADILGGCH